MNGRSHREIERLQQEVSLLTERVIGLEIAVRTLSRPAAAPAPAEPVPVEPWPSVREKAAFPPRPPLRAPDPMGAAAPQPRAPTPRPTPRPQRPRVDWGKLVEQLFTARTLAWAGGVATALGVVLLFVMAASRGWITPGMRVGLGVLVSFGLLGAALELDRRSWRADAILSAAGAGITGLYASLWASTSMYHFFGPSVAVPSAALIAALAVAVAIRIRQEPLAVFGMSGAMVAPILVSRGITPGGVLFAAVMMTATLPLHVRCRWRMVVSAAWAVGFAETVWLLVVNTRHSGFSPAVADTILVTVIFVCTVLLLELREPYRTRVSGLGWLMASSAFALSTAGMFLFADNRNVTGHSLSGLTLLGVAGAWALVAAVPYAVRRPHPDLTDILAAFSLTAAAAATGFLLGGPALVCAWAAEAAMLIGAAERIARRSGHRQRRLIVASGVYLTLATACAVKVVVPTAAHLPRLGSGSAQGAIALIAIAIAGVAYCYGVRAVAARAKVALWALPALAIGYMPLWTLPADWAVVGYAGIATALVVYRRTPRMINWLLDDAAVAIASAWWAAGAAVVLVAAARLRSLVAEHWVGLGDRHGLLGLAALVLSAGALTWSVRRPWRPGAEYVLLLPVVTLAYLIAEALSRPYAFWAWIAVGGALAAVVHAPDLRKRLLVGPLLAGAAGMVGLGVLSSWAADRSLRALAQHGTSAGWPSIAIAVVAATILATALLDRRRRSHALVLPAALAAQLAAMLLSGQYPIVVWALLAAAASVTAIIWPGPLQERLDRGVLLQQGIVGAALVSVIVLLAYETPRMLFQSSHSPAAGLAAAIAASASLALAAAAARRLTRDKPWVIAGLLVSTILVYSAGSAALWTLSAAILGAGQLFADAGAATAVHDRFQQGHVLVSISWVLVGLGFVVASLRGDRRGLRVGGIALLFVALGKLFLYDLAFLTAMARAISFIATGSVLLFAALLLQRFVPQVKAVLSDDHHG